MSHAKTPDGARRLLAKVETEVACSRQQAFDYAINLENFGQWFPGVLEIVAEDSRPAQSLGKTYIESVMMPISGARKTRIELKAVQPGHHFATEAGLKPLLPRMEMDFEALGDTRCRVRWRMYSRNRNRWFRGLVLPLASRVLRKRARQAMQVLPERLLAHTR